MEYKGYTFAVLRGERLFAVTVREDGWGVDPQDCPQFDNEESAKRWADEMELLCQEC